MIKEALLMLNRVTERTRVRRNRRCHMHCGWATKKDCFGLLNST